MKRLLIVAMLLMSSGAFADNTEDMVANIDELAQRMKKQKEVACKSMEQTAMGTMFARQNGVPMAEAFAAANHDAFIESVIKDAYKLSLYQTDGMKKQTIIEFSNKYFMDCMDNKFEIDYSNPL